MTERRKDPGQHRGTPPVEYLDLAGVAQLLGLKDVAYVYQLRWRYRDREPRWPEPDLVIAGREAWLPETIEAWRRQRPGRGAGGGRPRGSRTGTEREQPSSK